MVGLYSLSLPAKIYLVISIITMLAMLYHNRSYNDVFCLGSYDCNIGNKSYLFFINIIYIIFWSWLLNIIYANGHIQMAWGLVLLPFVLFFVLSASLFRFV